MGNRICRQIFNKVENITEEVKDITSTYTMQQNVLNYIKKKPYLINQYTDDTNLCIKNIIKKIKMHYTELYIESYECNILRNYIIHYNKDHDLHDIYNLIISFVPDKDNKSMNKYYNMHRYKTNSEENILLKFLTDYIIIMKCEMDEIERLNICRIMD